MRKILLIVLAVFSFEGIANADTPVTPEASEAYTQGILPKATVNSQVLYETVKGRDVSAELAFVVSMKRDNNKGTNQAAQVDTYPKEGVLDPMLDLQLSLMPRDRGVKKTVPVVNTPINAGMNQAAQVDADAKKAAAYYKETLALAKLDDDPAERQEAPVVNTPITFPTPTQIQISIILHGRGASFRRWVPQRFVLSIPGTNTRLTPTESIKIYIQKQSAITPIAPYLFGAMGAMYEGPGAQAANNPGTACPVTGEAQGGGANRGDTAQAIDRAGMAAGLGLLTSTAKGELEGQKSTFFLEAMPSDGKLLLQFEALNKDKHTTETLSIPFTFSDEFSNPRR